MSRTHFILDGLQDPLLGQALSAHWARAGFHNAVDPAGQCAWLTTAPGDSPGSDPGTALSEPQAEHAASIARRFGLEIRDRVCSTYQSDNDLPALRDRVAYEYKSRFATAIVFGLPALALHYLGPVLAGGGVQVRSMLYPWLFEMLLTGWLCVAAGWPILWQGVLAMRYRRATIDMLTTAIIAIAFIPSAVGVLSMPFVDCPWFGSPNDGGGPIFHAAVIAITMAILARWLTHRAAHYLAGRTDLMLAHFSRLIAAWLILVLITFATAGWYGAVAVGLLLPPMISSAAVNRTSPGWSVTLPVFAFTILMLIGPRALDLPLHGVQIETAGAFTLMMTLVFAAGWRQSAQLTTT